MNPEDIIIPDDTYGLDGTPRINLIPEYRGTQTDILIPLSVDNPAAVLFTTLAQYFGEEVLGEVVVDSITVTYPKVNGHDSILAQVFTHANQNEAPFTDEDADEWESGFEG